MVCLVTFVLVDTIDASLSASLFFFSLRLEVWNVPGCDMRFPLVPLSWPSEMGKMQYANASTEGLVRIL